MIKRKKLSSGGSLTHPNLVPRIEEFLKSRPTFKAGAATVVEHLMSHFNDYGRLGSNKLTLLVNNCASFPHWYAFYPAFEGLLRLKLTFCTFPLFRPG